MVHYFRQKVKKGVNFFVIYDAKKYLKKFLAVLLGAVVLVNTGIANTESVFAKDGDIITNECGDGWIGEGDACTP